MGAGLIACEVILPARIIVQLEIAANYTAGDHCRAICTVEVAVLVHALQLYSRI